jgi:colanic acid/amylovoran biosynthesis protein
MSHQNSTDENGNLVQGNDHRIINRLLELIGERYSPDQLFTLKGLYTAAQSKTIISKFDVLISGRIHGAVQGMSQCVPTGIIDYGHKPKAHKLRGFAKVYGIENYIADPLDVDAMKHMADALLENRQIVTEQLNEKVPEVKALALRNFELLKSL